MSGETYIITFDVLDSIQVRQYVNFRVTIDLQIRGNIVELTLPQLTFVLPDIHDDPIPEQVPVVLLPIPSSIQVPAGGQLTIVKNFLPRRYRPNTAIGITSTLESEQSGTGYILIITRDGNIKITGPGNVLISQAGPQIIHPKTITYQVADTQISIPTNFTLSQCPSQTFKFTGWSLVKQWYDLYWSAIYDGRIASRWADNSTTHIYPYNLNVLTRVGKIKTGKCGQTHIKLQKKPVVAVEAPLDWFYTAGTISINPTNPKNMIWTAILIRNDLITSNSSSNPDQLQLWRGVSLDGGHSWSTIGRIDANNGIPNAYSDSNGIFDSFGNHWITSLWYDPALGINAAVVQLMILVSSDQGLTYKIAYIPTTPPNFMVFDYNQLAFGGDGNGGWALWFCNDFFSLDGQYSPTINYIPVTGLGQYGSGVTVYLTSLANSVNISTLSVSNDGQIFLYYNYYSSADALALDAPLGLAYKLGGINNLVDGSFINLGTIAISNLGIAIEASPGIGNTYLPKSVHVRGNIQPNSRAVQYDNKRKVLYIIVNEFAPVYSQNMTIYLLASRDGQTWSSPYTIRDTTHGNAIRVSMSQDPIQGYLYITWYDGRCPSKGYVEFYGTILDNKILDDIVKTLPSGQFKNLPPAPIPNSGLPITLTDDSQRKLQRNYIRSQPL